MTARDRIWAALDDPALERHASLRNALYKLLVAIEFGRGPEPLSGTSSIERCLELAAEAIRDGSGIAVTRAHSVIEALVEALAAAATAATLGPTLTPAVIATNGTTV